MFHQIPDSVVVLRCKGVFKQSTCFTHNGQVFAKHGSGFVKLYKQAKGTSVPSVSWDDIQLPYEPTYNNLGVMIEGKSKPDLKVVSNG